MENLLELISSPVWWVTVVVAGILINLVSSYLRDLLDVRASRISSWWKERSETAKKEELKYIKRLKTDELFRTLHVIRYTTMRTLCIIWMLMGVIGFLSAVAILGHESKLEIAFLAIGSIAFFRAFQHLMKSSKYLGYAEDALDPEDT
ncbi:hypothetical protein [Pseudoalteromonas marina]|uniref:hypothetical protein n=1 Tax=Pseudoalteromonas marina TaxID=267375 RepID=UPI0023F1BD9B|nr:hypothetical protein [Pseudoalteromonas marina]